MASQPATPLLDIYIGLGTIQPHGPQQQEHWTLILSPQPNSPSNCLFYHVDGGPTHYRHVTETDKSLHDARLSSITKIGTAPCTVATLQEIHRKTQSIRAQRCHIYIARLIRYLERKGWAGPGTAQSLCDYHGLSGESTLVSRARAGEEVGVEMDAEIEMEIEDARRELVRTARAVRAAGLDSLSYCTCFF
ncbi:uncharacterized protein DSM5745_04500 [Aspergillus mulundensis]|uniref:Uncharacterized protein n=1 Tax=Aspergillus mulundensis TaxID=1810919 RepID=A0A3D8SDJ6_9EURO|nr:hypothetical protein DSM5745_04500 [Aspergillus mulundensis]RDW84174.1 hypothetical protein DSM5745_04500 [Aspergillus mulundensis]